MQILTTLTYKGETYLTVRSAAIVAGVSRQYLYKYISDGKLKTTTIDGTKFVLEEDARNIKKGNK